MPPRRRHASRPDSEARTRPLPLRPSVEYERKQAKALLRLLRRGNRDALARARARHPEIARRKPNGVALADAQLVLAREYGFASWQRLVQYFREVERQSVARHSQSIHDPTFFEQSARSLVKQHANRGPNAARLLAASVPRLYGLTIDEALSSTITEEEARLAVARQQGCASWEALMDALAAARRADPWRRRYESLRAASVAINASDLHGLKGILAEHPDLLEPSQQDRREFLTVIHATLGAEERRVPGARAMTDWLATQGFDVQHALTELLFDFRPITPEAIRCRLERGADPNGVAPNGLSVIEFALLRYWNSEAVDLIAQRVTARSALWIAAGLGRIAKLDHFLDATGNPTQAARRSRPDFAAVGFPALLTSAPDDTEVLAEAFFVALLNDRIAVLDHLIDRGFPVDYLYWETPFLNFAVGNQRVRVVECLVRRGANLDLKGRHPDMSARELARECFEQRPNDATARRILALCSAGDPAVVIAEHEARPAPDPQFAAFMPEALALAADDAARRGQSKVRPENLAIGVMRGGALDVFRRAGLDMTCLRTQLETRVLPTNERVDHHELPLDEAAQNVIRAAVDRARQRRSDVITTSRLVRALIDYDDGFLRDLLFRCGARLDDLAQQIDSWPD